MITRYKATYDAKIGNKRQNTLICNAGLGIQGVFVSVPYVVTWKAGEDVNWERAQAQERVLMDGINSVDEDMACASVTLTKLEIEALSP